MIDLRPFCERPSGHFRSYLSKPWSIGEWTYASNGHSAIRVPRREDVPENSDAPASVATIFAGADDLTYEPLPAIEIPKAKLLICRSCRGAGYGDKCQTCEGTGSHECTCGHEHECGDCEGSGLSGWRARNDIPEAERHYCVECGGLGHDADTRDVIFKAHEMVLGAVLLAPILRLPGPISMAVPPKVPDQYFPSRMQFKGGAMFRFDGGIAVILPRSYFHQGEESIIVPATEKADA